MKSVIWPLRCGVLQASQTQAIHPDAPCGSQPQQLSDLLVKNESVTGNVPKNLSAGRTLKEHVAADQQSTRMGIDSRDYWGSATVPSRVGSV